MFIVLNNFSGIAYGEEDIEFCKKFVVSFIDDINNFENMVNIIQNNYY